jgi:GTPase SAR1 family protein
VAVVGDMAVGKSALLAAVCQTAFPKHYTQVRACGLAGVSRMRPAV